MTDSQIFAKFSVEAIMVMLNADNEARRLGHNYIDSEQLLLGIVAEPSNQATRYLAAVLITLELLRECVEARIGRGAGELAIELPATSDVRRVYALANDYARNSATVAPEHLMLGILDFSEGVVSELLEELGVELEAFRSHLIEALDKIKLTADAEVGIEREAILAEAIILTALPQENGRWVCSVKGDDLVRPVLVYAATRQQAVSLGLRQWVTALESNLS